MNIISSKDNEFVKHIRKLKNKKYRDEFSEYIIEGTKIIQEAIAQSVPFSCIVICEDCIENKEIDSKLMYAIAKYKCIYVTRNVFNTLTDAQNPQGMLAIACMPENIKTDTVADLIVVLEAIQDPGNLGSILRTIDSVGLKQVIISKNSADVYNPKVVRSTMGAIFRVNVIETENMADTLQALKKQKYKIVSTSLDAGKSVFGFDFSKSVLVIGNEGNGVSEEIIKLSNELVKIPMPRQNRKPKCSSSNRNNPIRICKAKDVVKPLFI